MYILLKKISFLFGENITTTLRIVCYLFQAIERIGGADFEKRCIELKNQTLRQNNMEISNAVEYMCTSHVPALTGNNVSKTILNFW